jgi:hypothetical protein
MSKFGLGALALATIVSCLAFAGTAEARWAPSGSYESTCRHINFDGDLLTASCQRRDGSWRNTYLDNAGDCDSNIGNNDGQLQCGWRGWRTPDYRDSGPSGSYERSCTNIRMDGYTLRATCQRFDGGWRWASLDYAYDCNGRIANNNGYLVCGRGRGHW